jgi:hypothetical protein
MIGRNEKTTFIRNNVLLTYYMSVINNNLQFGHLTYKANKK